MPDDCTRAAEEAARLERTQPPEWLVRMRVTVIRDVTVRAWSAEQAAARAESWHIVAESPDLDCVDAEMYEPPRRA